MIYLEVNSIYDRKFRNGLIISQPIFMYYSFIFKRTITKPYYNYSGFQKLRYLTVT